MKATIRMWQRRITAPPLKLAGRRFLTTVKKWNNIDLKDTYGLVFFLFIMACGTAAAFSFFDTSNSPTSAVSTRTFGWFISEMPWRNTEEMQCRQKQAYIKLKSAASFELPLTYTDLRVIEHACKQSAHMNQYAEQMKVLEQNSTQSK